MKCIGKTAAWFFAGLCWCMAIWLGSGILEQKDSLSLRLDQKEEGVTSQMVRQMAESYHLAAYEESGRMEVTVPVTGRKANIAMIRAAGDRSLITGSWLTDGSFGISDEGECVISSGAAVKLFGSERAAGLTIFAEGQEWLIRGVFRAGREVVLLPAEGDVLLTNFEFRFSGSEDNKSAAEQVCYQYGLSQYYKIIDYRFFGAAARLFLWLPFLVLPFSLRRLKRKVIKQNCLPGIWHDAVPYVLELLFWACLLLFLFQAFRFPPGFIPAKWSDFNFWGERWKEVLTSLDHLLIATLMKDRILRAQFSASILFSVAAAGIWAAVMSNSITKN